MNIDSEYLITLTEGNDTYASTLAGATINALGGNDSVKNFDVSDVSISGGAGADDLSNRGGNNLTLTGGAGNDSLWNEPNDGGKDALKISISGGAGNDSINNFGNKATLSGGAGSDTIINYRTGYRNGTLVFDDVGQSAKIFGNDGSDYIRNDGKKSKVDAGAGNDSIQNNGGADYCTLLGGDGDDTINNEMDGTLSGGENVFIDGGSGNDSLRNDNSRGTISGGADNDTLANWGDLSSLDGGAGNDSIYNYQSGDSVTIDAGAGSDKVSNRGDNVTILGGAGADTINNNGTNDGSKKVTIDAGAGNDEIHNFGTNDLIKGGAGNDKIWNNKRGVINGEVVVEDGGKSSTIIGGAGNDYISNSGDKVTFKYFSGDGNDSIVGFNDTSTLTLDDGAGTYSSVKSGNDLIVTVGDGKITLWGAATLSAVNISGKEISAWKLDGTTATYSTGGKILATVKNVKSLDGLSVNKKVVTVSAASLAEKKVSITGDGYTLALGSDVDTSTTKKSWSLKDSTATYKQTTAAGYSLKNNSIIYSEKISKTLATIKGVNDKSGLKVSGKTIKLSGDALSKKVTVSGDYVFDFASDFKNATITGSSSNDTIIARGKNIFVTGGKGADIFEFKSTGAVGDYEEADKISLSSAANISVSGSDVIINGKVTLTGAADKSVTYIENGAEKFFKASADVEYNSKGTAATLLVTYTPDTFTANETLITIKASAVKHSLEITGNKNANVITATSEDDLIYGQAGGDTISGGKGDDSILGGAGSDSLNGGGGNDSLWGDTGSDTLTGGAGSDIFFYASGDGSDLISDYTSVDTVIILSGKVESPFVDTEGNVTFQIGAGQLLFPNSANKYIELLDTDGNIKGKYTPIKS